MIGSSHRPQRKNHKILGTNIIQDKLFDEENQHMVDALLKLLMLSSEFKLSNLIADFNCFTQVFNINSAEVNVFLEQSFFQNQQCSGISNMKWDKAH